MNYQLLLFDLDQTLFDTNTNAENALRKMQLPFEFTFNADKINYWHRLQAQMWAGLERKEMTRDELINTRFSKYFAHYDIAADGPTLERQFQQRFFAEHTLMPHARTMLTQLKQRYHLAVVSNEVRAKQVRQMGDAHIDQFFDRLFLAEEVGFSKPDQRFFQTVKAKYATVDPANMLVIGDSLTADIQGARAAHLDSVWFNPNHAAQPATNRPRYEVNDLQQLVPLLAD
ncbi:YjjG family noncanonical pyrimidine nucleotidase [Lactiplantibacillus garii]|uniref:YjjG family noncanonical pyrimidine nucleotidase n=1 Tax=Lactiplantibacillus garii TaxID=2306423 RepID=UPI00131567C7|nr:YjjG family noncanonical pyrimidine nucleotidase [Lactiplantibacillus garii]